MKTLLSLLFLSLLTNLAIAQDGYNWPEDEGTAREKLALYSDAFKLKDYANAVEPLKWLYENAPDLNSSIYINGAKVFEEMAKKEADEAKKAEYQEMTLKIYDDRIKYFNDEVNVLNRKGFAAYKFYKARKDKYEELYTLYESIVEKSGNNLSPNLLVAYMDVLRRYNAASKKLSDDEILEKYDKLSAIMDHKIKAGDKAELVKKQKPMVDKILTSIVKVDCDFIKNKLGPRLEQNPDDLGLAKRIMGLALAANCSQIPVFLDAAKVVQDNEPDFGIAKIIGIRSAANGDFDTSIEYFNQAVDLASDNSKKTDVYYEMALQFSKRGQKANARKYARQALSVEPSMSKAYKLIGDLYFNSFDDCKKLENRVDDRAIYLVAYDMYEKAGNKRMMDAARAQFPSIGEIFELNLEEGKSITVGCWINESTILRRRPE